MTEDDDARYANTVTEDHDAHYAGHWGDWDENDAVGTGCDWTPRNDWNENDDVGNIAETDGNDLNENDDVGNIAETDEEWGDWTPTGKNNANVGYV